MKAKGKCKSEGKDIGKGKKQNQGKHHTVLMVTHKHIKGDYKTKERHRESTARCGTRSSTLRKKADT